MKRESAIEREAIEALLSPDTTIAEMAAKLSCGPSRVSYWLRRYGLDTPAMLRRAELHAALASGSSLRRRCRRHGDADFALVGSERRPRCKLCRSEAVARRRRRVKELLVEEAGGACIVCGYDTYAGALHFHHLVPADKRFGLARGGVTLAIARVREEARKCILLCSNCHAEIEAGVTSVPLESSAATESGVTTLDYTVE